MDNEIKSAIDDIIEDKRHLVIVAFLLTEKREDNCVLLSAICKVMFHGEMQQQVIVKTFPRLRLSNGILMAINFETAIATWLINTWMRQDTRGRVHFYQLEKDSTPSGCKMPGVWRKISQL